MAFDDVTVDYGEQGPEHFDRFGLRHYAQLRARHKVREFVDVNLNAPIKRFGLTLKEWRQSWQGVHRYLLNIHGRPLEIRRYSDGRIKLFLDDQAVYTEDIRVITRHGERYRDVKIWVDPALETLEREAARQARLDAVRDRLEGNR